MLYAQPQGKKIPEYTLHQIDSLIGTHQVTAIFFWPTWCMPCNMRIKPVIDIFSDVNTVPLYFIAEAHSGDKTINKLSALNTKPYITFIRQKNEQRKPIFSINNYSSVIAFNKHYTGSLINEAGMEDANLRFPTFYLLDGTGNIIYSLKNGFSVDSVRTVMENFAQHKVKK